MKANRLQKRVLSGLLALSVAGASLLVASGDARASSVRQQDGVIAAVEAGMAGQDSPTAFSARIQRILDEFGKKDTQAAGEEDVQTGHIASEGGEEQDAKRPAKARTEVKEASAPPAPPSGASLPAIPELQEGRYNFDWQGTPIAQSLYAVAKIAHRDVVVNGGLSGKVYMSLHQVTCNEAMDFLSRAFNFNWMADGNAILVSTDKLMKQSETFKIHHAVDLEKVQGELTALGIEAASVYANAEARSVSVTGTPYQLRQARQRLEQIDRPVSQCLILAQLIELNHGKELSLGMQYSLPTYSHTASEAAHRARSRETSSKSSRFRPACPRAMSFPKERSSRAR